MRAVIRFGAMAILGSLLHAVERGGHRRPGCDQGYESGGIQRGNAHAPATHSGSAGPRAGGSHHPRRERAEHVHAAVAWPQDIVVKGKRIGGSARWAMEGQGHQHLRCEGLWAGAGFGESDKHIESTLLSPEYEAALAIPIGNTWTSEGSHEFSNVSGEHNVEFWLAAEKAGGPAQDLSGSGIGHPAERIRIGGGYTRTARSLRTCRRAAGIRASTRSCTAAVLRAGAPGLSAHWEDMQATRDIPRRHRRPRLGTHRPRPHHRVRCLGPHERPSARIAEEAWEKLQRLAFSCSCSTTSPRSAICCSSRSLKEWGTSRWLSIHRRC